jgi:hypothetical protein
LDFKDLERNIHKLANLEEADEPVVSCYINLETRYRGQLNERMRALHGRIERDRRPAFWEAVGLIEVFIGTGIRPESKGAAVFSRGGHRPFFLALQFGAPLPNSVTVSGVPHIYHLVALRDNCYRYVVMLSGETAARILEVNLGTITETVRKERSELSGWAGRNWTRERYESRRQEQTRRFLYDQIRVLHEVMSTKEYRYFFLAGEPRITAQIHKALPKQLSSMLVALVRGSSNESNADLVAATLPSFLEFENRQSMALADRLHSEINGRGLAATGTGNCLKALQEDRAATLVLANTYAPNPAWLCSSCGEVVIAPEAPCECAACKVSVFRELDTREEIVRLAERNSLQIEIVENSSAMEAIGGIGCFLRYQDLERYCRPIA